MSEIQSRQDAIRQRYLDYAAELQRSGTARDDALARQIRQFIKDMPADETRRHVLKKELSSLPRAGVAARSRASKPTSAAIREATNAASSQPRLWA